MKKSHRVFLLVVICGFVFFRAYNLTGKTEIVGKKEVVEKKETMEKNVPEHRKKIIALDLYNSDEKLVEKLGAVSSTKFKRLKFNSEVGDIEFEGLYGCTKIFKIDTDNEENISLKCNTSITGGKIKIIMINDEKITKLFELEKDKNELSETIEVQVKKGENTIYAVGENVNGKCQIKL